MKYILSFLTCLLLTTYCFAAYPVPVEEAPAEKSQTKVVEKSNHTTFVKLQKLVPQPASAGGHGMAILSIVLGIIGLFVITPAAHVLFGALAILIGLSSMRRHMFRRPLAIAGVVLGIIDLLLLL